MAYPDYPVATSFPTSPGARRPRRPAARDLALAMSPIRLQAILADAAESERLFSALLESAPDAMVVLDVDGTMVILNAQAERLFGHPREELLGRPVELLLPERFRQDHVGHRRRYASSPTVRPMGATLELLALRRDGSEFPVEISLSPIPTAEGLLIASTIRDVSEQRRAARELQSRADELARSNQDLDDFAYIVSHDLKEPLRGIASYATFLQEDYADRLDAKGKEQLSTLGRLCERMETLLSSLLYYSRVGRAALSVADTDLGAVARDAGESLAIALQQHGARLSVPRPLPRLRCDALRTGEVYQNLIMNALKYNDRTDKQVELGYRDAPDPQTGIGPVLYVRDNGIGIPARHVESVFGMFKRLHGRDKYGGGTGSGLSITRKIVERHGGRIWVESTPGEGSTFCFTLGDHRP